MIEVEVAYATPERQWLLPLSLPEGSTVAVAIAAARLNQAALELPEVMAAVGIFGKVCSADQVLKAGDRVEIYRDLHNDPKAARRQRAQVR